MSKSFIVTGTIKSGTSMVAGSLRILGVNMGESFGASVERPDDWRDGYSEDWDMFDAMKAGDSEMEEAVRYRSEKYEAWGFKLPDLLDHLGYLESKCPNPHFIFVFRDPYAIALRRVQASIETKAVQEQRQSVMRDICYYYGTLVGEMSRMKAPILPVSYEKALQFPDRFALGLNKFTGLPIDSRAVKKVATYISPEAMYPRVKPYLERK